MGSCDPYTSGCNGGWPYLSYDYICSDRPTKGIDTEQSYPYTAQTGTCNNAIVDDPSCGQSVNHAVTAVGYDKSAGYWLVRNSWGGSWGEAGYIKMVKNKNMCNMLSHCVVPTGAR